MNEYDAFIEKAATFSGAEGPPPVFMPDAAMDFQRFLIDWAFRRQRGAVFADCGLGKTLIQLAFAENVVRLKNKPVLIATPLAVCHQTVQEGEKFGIECSVCRDGKHKGGIVVTNYERMHYFDPSDFAAFVCDESGAIKNFDAARSKSVIDFSRGMEYRHLGTATAAPNDFFELGTSSEALGYLGWRDMITTFFKQETKKDRLGWGRSTYRFRGHAERPFWQWVCSWARAVRKPSDIGFSDERFQLPPLIEHEHLVDAGPRDGMLFSMPAKTMHEQRAERRNSITERCEKIAELIEANGDNPGAVWCHLNPEGDLLENLIPGCVQVKGSQSDEEKEELLSAFSSGQVSRLVTKPKIGCWGLNWQHCSNVYAFPSHSYEQHYQLIRRFYRFGQKNPVTLDMVTTEGEAGVVKNMKRKAEQADRMFSMVVECMANELGIVPDYGFPTQEEVPSWLSKTNLSPTDTRSTTVTASR